MIVYAALAAVKISVTTFPKGHEVWYPSVTYEGQTKLTYLLQLFQATVC